MISVRLRQELGGSRDSLRTGRGSQHNFEITAIAPDKTQRIVSTLPAVKLKSLTLREKCILIVYENRGAEKLKNIWL
jgi:hypothetical protein